MQGMFTEVKLVSRGAKVRVTGEFDPGNRKITRAKVLFMIVQGDGGPDTVILDGEAEWVRPANSAGKVLWSVRVDNQGVFADGHKGKAKLEPNAKDPMVRGIAHAIAFKPGGRSRRSMPGKPLFEPPQIDALTWCVETPLEPRRAPQQARSANGRRPVSAQRRGRVVR